MTRMIGSATPTDPSCCQSCTGIVFNRLGHNIPYAREYIVMGEMKTGSIVPRVGIDPTFLALRPSTLTITSCRTPLCHHHIHAYLFMQLFVWEISAMYYTNPPGIVSLVSPTITYIQAVTSQGRFRNHTAHSLYRILGEMKMGNIMPRVGIEPTSLAFWVSVW